MNQTPEIPIGSVLVPGHRICPVDPHTAGRGVYVRNNYIHAAIIGTLERTGTTINVTGRHPPPVPAPKLNDVVMGRVMKISSSMGVSVDLLSHIGNAQIPLDKISVPALEQAFICGDLVRAQVVGLGRVVILSTVGIEFGVVYSKGRNGEDCVVKGWDSVECSNGVMEGRKCARPTGPLNAQG